MTIDESPFKVRLILLFHLTCFVYEHLQNISAKKICFVKRLLEKNGEQDKHQAKEKYMNPVNENVEIVEHLPHQALQDIHARITDWLASGS
jgi:hypothetical protein